MSSTVQLEQIASKKIVTDLLIATIIELGGVQVSGITENFNDVKDGEIPSSKAFKQELLQMQTVIDTMQELIEDFKFTPVISEAIVTPAFSSKDWIATNFYFNEGSAIYNSTSSDNTGTVYLDARSFRKAGTYIMTIEVPNLDSGQLAIRLYGVDDIKIITTPGTYTVSFTIDNPSTVSLYLVTSGVAKGDQIRISSCAIYHVANALTDYLMYMAEYIVSDGAGIVTEDEMESRMDQLATQLRAYVNTAISTLETKIANHISNLNNPHETDITYVALGTIKDWLGADSPTNYAFLDGQSMSTIDYSELLQYATDNSLVVTRAEYDAAMLTNGYCNSFSFDDGDSVFYLPSVLVTGSVKKIIKINEA